MSGKNRLSILSRFVALCLVLQFVTTGCGSNGENDAGGVDMSHIYEADSMTFEHDASRVCVVTSSVDADYPQYYVNDTLTRQLQALYVNEVLGVAAAADSSVAIQEAVAMRVAMQINQFGDSEDEILYGVSPNKEFLRYTIATEVTAMPVEWGIATFCRHEKVDKDGEAATDAHHYINIDLATMSRVDVYDLFAEDALSYVSSLLKDKLLDQVGAKDEEDLIGQGYFNLDNIAVNNNFYFGNDGITWNYTTYEIACYSVGETQITLGFDALSPYVSRESNFIHIFKTKIK